MHGAGPLRLGELEGVPENRRNGPGVDDGDRVLGDRLHHADDVDELEPRLPVLPDRLLSRDGDERRADQLRVRDAGHEVRGPRPERGEADPGLSGEPSVGGCHERRRLFVARDDQLDLRRAQRFEKIEVLLAGQAEDIFNAFLFQLTNEQVRCLHAISQINYRRDAEAQRNHETHQILFAI